MNILILSVIIIIILIGVVGTVVPLIPGIPLIFITIAAYGWHEGFHTITVKYLVILAGLTILSMLIDYLSTVMGAKYFGSSKKGIWGAFLGTFIGLFIFPPLGILLGPWLGAVIGEYLELNDINKAIRVGMGTVVGLFSGIIFNFILALLMLVSFIAFVF